MTEISLEQWKQAHQIYAELMDLTVSDALQQLQQHAEADDTTKGLVLQLISSGNQSSQFFQQEISAQIQAGMGSKAALQAGDRVGEYELLEALGQGGMASVFKARRVGVESQKPVAIKVFNHAGASSVLADRFAVEQEILSGLSHPNIVNMHHGGSSDQGVPYISMELIEQATDVDVYAKQQQASVRQIISWMVQAAKAIAYAHNNLIVHRDIKPSNLLMDAKGRLKVVDFGIAKLMSKQDSPQKTTIMALTPSYAAPEQINSGHISVTTDVFSLAVVCLALITGEPPLPPDRLLKSCAEDESRIWQVLKTEVHDKDLRNILNQALQQDPKKRYRNMDLFANDLSAWLDNKPVQATPDSWRYRIQKFAKRRSALFATLVTLVLTMALSVGMLTWQYNKTRTEAQKALEVKNFMLNVFAVTHPDVNQGEALTALDLLQKARTDIETAYQNNPALKADLLLAIGTAFYQVGDWEKAQSTLAAAHQVGSQSMDVVMSYAEVLAANQETAALNQLRSLHSPMFNTNNHDSFQARRLRLLSNMAVNEGLLDEAKRYLEQAIELDAENQDRESELTNIIAWVKWSFSSSEYQQGIAVAEQAIKDYSPFFAPAHTTMMKLKNELSVLYTKSGQYQKSQQLLEEILELEKRYLGLDHPDLIQTMISLSESYSAQHMLDEARDISTQAHELTAKKFGPKHPKMIESYNGLATVVFIQGEYQMALDLMVDAIAISEESLGLDHSDTLKLKRNYATALGALRRNEESVAVLEEVLEQQMTTLGPKHRDTLFTQLSLVRSYGGMGRSAQAVHLGETVIGVLKEDEELSAGPIYSNAMYALGFAYFDDQRYQQAIDTFLAIESQQLESEVTANFMVMCKTLSRSYLAIHAWEQAEHYARKAQGIAIELMDEKHIRTIKINVLLAEILLKSGQFEAARALLDATQQHLHESQDQERDVVLQRVHELQVMLPHE